MLNPSLGPWLFILAGLMLMAAEMVVPGAFLVWFGIAAVATGVVDLLLAPPWQVDLLLFCVFAVAAVLAARALTRGRGVPAAAEPPFLNRRGDALVGRCFPLASPIVDGSGTIRVDDTIWRVMGPSAAAGEQVRVLRVIGVSLEVERAGAGPDPT
ncbi:NfeD family protein [Chelatococcus reniformis]|uniref:Membrane protein n=1 Tax=Chelatococcus reniformis TaxID=1494448 RepID=A0A916U9B0_9HYPH|nr:NfeD family protein [Chelatococcus reniformis]GGC63862.1 membrane protein [Chelatococcus reniformis]